jgi:S-adenosylmethionine synthetase
MNYSFSSESVCAGHPDKICDQISDAIVDAALSKDVQAHVAVETLATTNQIVLAGEVTCIEKLPFESIARDVIQKLGYIRPEYHFSNQSPVSVYIHNQSSDISLGVDDGGAGDQGLMFGYACNQTKELMPLPIMLAHGLTREMDELSTRYAWNRPDGKSQVTVYYENNVPKSVEKVVLARPHDPLVQVEDMKKMLYREVVLPVLQDHAIDINQLIVNGTGRWEVGGPAIDSGVTGRKIIVDTYGGWARHGGGCFSGKDATKVDRSGAYAARWAAKNVVAHGLASECEIQVAYAIGVVEPISVMIETFGTATKSSQVIRDFVSKLTSFKVGEIIEKLGLRKPVFGQTAVYGHFGRDLFSWEQIIGL